MGKELILVGGGHAHMVTLANLQTFVDQGHSVTVVGPSDYHYYSGMGPGMLGGVYRPEEIRFATRRVVENRGATFIRDKAVGIDPQQRLLHLESGATRPYDVISFNAGSFVPRPPVIDSDLEIYSVKPIVWLQEARDRLLQLFGEREITITIVGGGPSAAEVAGNVWSLARAHGTHPPIIRILAGQQGFMARFPAAIRRRAEGLLAKRGIEVVAAGYVKEIRGRRVMLQSGQGYASDFVFLALGVRPAPFFAESGLPTGPDGGLLVNEFLQCPTYPEIFGGGDCIHFQPQPLDKVGVYAVRQNPVLCHNLLAALAGTPLQPFAPGGGYLLIFNLGDRHGILRKGRLLFGGRLAFRIKDYIDRRFMRKFQALE